MLNQIFGPTRPWDNVYRTGRDRIRLYARYKRLYDGWAVRGYTPDIPNFQYHRLKFNPSYSIVNIGAEFLAGKDIKIQINKNPGLTDVANTIWERSGGSASFFDAAITGSIYGDACVMLGYNGANQLILKWMDTAVCFPSFDVRDTEKLTDFIIAYQSLTPLGNYTTIYEEWSKGEVKTTNDGNMDETAMKVIGNYDPDKYDGGPPVVWIPNLKLKGEAFGRSDINPIVDLTEEYDHLMTKLGRQVDYYSNPNLYMKGVRKPEILTKGERTIYFLPADGDAGFIEWHGTPPSVERHIEDIRGQISELTATPKIAFSNVELSNGDISGVALKVLFGPLLSKNIRKQTQTYGYGIRRIIRFALRELGHKVDLQDIAILWQNPLPNNTKEDWEIAVMQDLEGVSHAQIQRERGYTEDQIAQMLKERQAEKEQDVALAVQQAVEIAKGTAPYTGMGNSSSGGGGGKKGKSAGGGPKAMSAEQKKDHTGTTTPGKIINAPGATGSKGAV